MEKIKRFSVVKNILSACQFGFNVHLTYAEELSHRSSPTPWTSNGSLSCFYFYPLPPHSFPKPKPLTAAAVLLLQCLLHFKHCRLHTAHLQRCPAWRTCLKSSWCADRLHRGTLKEKLLRVLTLHFRWMQKVLASTDVGLPRHQAYWNKKPEIESTVGLGT